MKLKRFCLSSLVLLAFFLAACFGPQGAEDGAGGNETGSQPQATAAHGTEAPGGTGASEDENPGGTADSSRLTGLLGLQVNDLTGSLVGIIDSIVISSGSGQIFYALLKPAGAGVQPGLVVVPWELLQANSQVWEGQDMLTFNREAKALAEAPTLPAEGTVDFSDPAWDDEAVSYWAAAGVALPETGGNLRSGVMLQLRLLDRQAASQDGTVLGGVPDMLLDPANGFILYLLVETGEKLVPVPYTLVEYNPESGNYTVRSTPEQVQNAPGFPSLDQIPDLSDPDWEGQIQAYWDSLGQ